MRRLFGWSTTDSKGNMSYLTLQAHNDFDFLYSTMSIFVCSFAHTFSLVTLVDTHSKFTRPYIRKTLLWISGQGYCLPNFHIKVLVKRLFFMPPKELWEAYSNHTLHPSVPLRVRCKSRIFFEVGIPSLVCACILE